MKIITFINNKGGVGKTTLCFNLGRALQEMGRLKYILIDADPQSSLRDWHNTGTHAERPDLVGADTRQSLLSASRMHAESNYDYMLIDTAGKISEITGAALSVTDLAIIPIQPSALDVWATLDSIDLLRAVMKGNPRLRAMFVINQAIPNCTINKEVIEALKTEVPDIPLCSTLVHGRISFAQSANIGNTVFETNDLKAQAEINNISFDIMQVTWVTND